MRIETETAVRSIVGFDSEVTKEMVERAIDILRGKTDADGGERRCSVVWGGGLKDDSADCGLVTLVP